MGQIGPSVGPSHQAGFPRMLPARDPQRGDGGGRLDLMELTNGET